MVEGTKLAAVGESPVVHALTGNWVLARVVVLVPSKTDDNLGAVKG